MTLLVRNADHFCLHSVGRRQNANKHGTRRHTVGGRMRWYRQEFQKIHLHNGVAYWSTACLERAAWLLNATRIGHMVKIHENLGFLIKNLSSERIRSKTDRTSVCSYVLVRGDRYELSNSRVYTWLDSWLWIIYWQKRQRLHSDHRLCKQKPSDDWINMEQFRSYDLITNAYKSVFLLPSLTLLMTVTSPHLSLSLSLPLHLIASSTTDIFIYVLDLDNIAFLFDREQWSASGATETKN